MSELNHIYLASIVKKAQDGSSDAFAELYSHTYKKIYAYGSRYLKDEHLAYDAMQDTYITALKHIGDLKDPSLFVAWLNQIHFHTCYDMCKKNSNSYGLFDPEILELETDVDIEHNPADNYERLDIIKRLNEGIENLPFLEKQVIVLKYFNDMKIEDIAKTLSISRSTVKRYLNSAKEKLAKIYKEDQ